jgi:hypothetical protein
VISTYNEAGSGSLAAEREAASDTRAVVQAKVSEREEATIVHSLGWLPVLSVVAGLGLFIVSVANTGARYETAWARPLFWTGLLVVFAPVVARLTWSRLSRREALGLVVLLGIALYLIKVLQSPLAFTYHDEFMHWRTVDDILSNKHLFTTNYLLPISSIYPGLEIANSAIANLTGLSVYGAGILLIGVARTLFMLGLFLLYEQISKSVQTAAIGVALYAANPNFIFFDAAFSYESLAISLTVLAVFTAVNTEPGSRGRLKGMTLVGLLVVLSVVTTHHLTGYLLAAFLLLWLVIDTLLILIRRKRERRGPLAIAIIVLVSSVVWTVSVASASIDYLAPPLTNALRSLMKLIAQEATPRRLFEQSSGAVTPLLDRVIGLGAVGLIMIVLPFGLWQMWKRHRTDSLAITLGLCALAYPVTLGLRFVGAAWEAANRSSEFLFLALALVLAVGIRPLLSPARIHLISRAVVTGGASLAVIGGVLIGWPPSWLLPGPYQVPVGLAGGSRSVEQQGVAGAEWAQAYLGPGNMIGADETNMLLMGTYGMQLASTTLSGGEDINWVLYAPTMEAEQVQVLQRGKVQYLVVDYRLATVPSLTKKYYPESQIAVALRKFDYLPSVSRIFDSGDIRIYDVRGLLDDR